MYQGHDNYIISLRGEMSLCLLNFQIVCLHWFIHSFHLHLFLSTCYMQSTLPGTQHTRMGELHSSSQGMFSLVGEVDPKQKQKIIQIRTKLYLSEVMHLLPASYCFKYCTCTALFNSHKYLIKSVQLFLPFSNGQVKHSTDRLNNLPNVT